MILRKKKKKGIKLNYRYQKRYSIYCVVGIVMLILLAFLFKNFGNCKIYSLSVNQDGYTAKNGLLILMKSKTIIKLPGLEYEGNIVNVKDVELTLCVDSDDECKEIYTHSIRSNDGVSYKESLSKMSSEIYDDIKISDLLTRKLRRKVYENLNVVLNVTTTEGKDLYIKLPVLYEEEYANNKLF